MSFTHRGLEKQLPMAERKNNEPVVEVTTNYLVMGEPDKPRRRTRFRSVVAQRMDIATQGTYPDGHGLYALDEVNL